MIDPIELDPLEFDPLEFDPLEIDPLEIEVVYASAARQWRVPLRLPHGATVGEAIAASALVERIPGLRIDPQCVGVFGQRCTIDRVLEAGDRVEIYRALVLDPKAQRRQRAKGFKRER